MKPKETKIVVTILYYFTFVLHTNAQEMVREVRYITPPKLDDSNVAKKIICHRPMRRGAPRMDIELTNRKVVAHNYGHGGSGWTLGPGAAQYVNTLLEKSYYGKFLNKRTPITIIGAGVIGLMTAYDLSQRGYTEITIIAEKYDDLTSHRAGALFAPVSMDNAPETQPIIDTIGIASYKFYAAIAEGKNNIIHSGARTIPAYFINRQESGLESYVGIAMKPAKDVIVNFGNGTQRPMVVYDDCIYIDTCKLVNIMTEYLKSRVKFVQKKITSFTQIESNFIINCTGLGTQELNNDQNMVPVQGHLILLRDQNPQDLEYMILVYNEYVKTKSGFNIQRSLYLFPKQLPDTPINDVGVLGGTFIEGATADTPHEEEFDIVLNGARQFYGITTQ